MKEFVLPKYWYIEINENNRDLLNNYRINIVKYSKNNIDLIYKYMYYNGEEGAGGWEK